MNKFTPDELREIRHEMVVMSDKDLHETMKFFRDTLLETEHLMLEQAEELYREVHELNKATGYA